MKTLNGSLGLLVGTILFYPAAAAAHGGNTHDSGSEKEKSAASNDTLHTDQKVTAYKAINKTYVKNIKPIFEKKCFDCHSNTAIFPWYYPIPGIKQMMDYDIKEAKEHLNMRWDFPFISHETPLKDLKSLRKIGQEGGMPPLRYILGHWDSRLTDNEKQTLVDWAEASIELLEKSGQQ